MFKNTLSTILGAALLMVSTGLQAGSASAATAITPPAAPSPLTATSAAGSDAVAPAATPKVCTASGCWVTATIDVDGDGRKDRVSSTRGALTDYPVWTIRVVTATKKVLSVTYRYDGYGLDSPPGNVWFGAAMIDGARGAELVVGGDSADSRWYRMYTHRAGRLVASPHPSGGLTWWASLDDNGAIGYRVTVSKGVRTLVVSDLLSRYPNYSGTQRTYRWSGARWGLVSSRDVTMTTARARYFSGWNVPGLGKGLAGPLTSECAPVIFTFGDNQAGSIEATNVSCPTTRTFIRALDATRPYAKRAFTFKGYFCRSVFHDAEIGYYVVGCIYRTKWISFARA